MPQCASNLCEIRTQLGLSQAECARALGVALRTFRTWDAGRRPAPEAVVNQAGTLRAGIMHPPESLLALFGGPRLTVKTCPSEERSEVRDGRSGGSNRATSCGQAGYACSTPACAEFLRSHAWGLWGCLAVLRSGRGRIGPLWSSGGDHGGSSRTPCSALARLAPRSAKLFHAGTDLRLVDCTARPAIAPAPGPFSPCPS